MSVDEAEILPFVLVIEPSGEAKIVQNLLTNADIVRHLKFVASWVESLPEDIGHIAYSERPIES